MISSVFRPEGYFDVFNSDKTELSGHAGANIISRRKFGIHESGTTRRFEFIICPNMGFLASPDLLMKDCELKLSFDRANVANCLVEYGTVTNVCTEIEIKDCYAVTEYVSSPSLRDHFAKIDTTPLVYEYDDCEVILKSIPLNDTDIRFDTIRGGNIPDYIFAAVIPQDSLNGEFETSSTYFKRHKVRLMTQCTSHYNKVNELNFTLNGNSVNGYPMSLKHGSPIGPMQKFFDVTNRLYNVQCGDSLDQIAFHYNFIWAHKFEGESTGNGWCGVDLKLDSGFAENMILVVWIVTSSALPLDKFHQIEKLQL